MYLEAYIGLLGISLAANIILWLYILLKKMKNLATFYYLFFMVGVIIHVGGDFMFQISGAEPLAVSWVFAYWLGYFVMGAFFFLFTTEYPRKKLILFKNEAAKLSVLILPIWMTYLMLYSRDFIKEIVIVSEGVNYVVYGPVYGLAISYIVLFIGVGLIIVLNEYYKTRLEEEKENIKLIFIGVFIAAVLGFMGDAFILRSLGLGELKLASIFILIGNIIIGYAVVSYRLFDIKPVSEEEETTEKPLFETEKGKNYFVHETRFPSKALRYFADQVRHKRQGLAVSTIFPKQINQRYGLKNTPIIWLSERKEVGVQSISPKDIQLLYRTLALFLERATRPVLLIEGLKELVIYNGAKDTIEFINTVTEKAAERNANVFFSLTKIEPKFIDMANEIKSLKTSINNLDKKFYSRNITEEAYLEILEDSEYKLVRAESELKVIEDEMVEKIVGVTKDERELLVLRTMCGRLEYKMNKRQLRESTGASLLKETQKLINEVERKLNKASKGIKKT